MPFFPSSIVLTADEKSRPLQYTDENLTKTNATVEQNHARAHTLKIQASKKTESQNHNNNKTLTLWDCSLTETKFQKQQQAN